LFDIVKKKRRPTQECENPANLPAKDFISTNTRGDKAVRRFTHPFYNYPEAAKATTRSEQEQNPKANDFSTEHFSQYPHGREYRTRQRGNIPCLGASGESGLP
jgi:hypothetical protein